MKTKRNETGINKNSLWGLTSFDRENWRQTLLLPEFEVFQNVHVGMRGGFEVERKSRRTGGPDFGRPVIMYKVIIHKLLRGEHNET